MIGGMENAEVDALQKEVLHSSLEAVPGSAVVSSLYAITRSNMWLVIELRIAGALALGHLTLVGTPVVIAETVPVMTSSSPLRFVLWSASGLLLLLRFVLWSVCGLLLLIGAS